MRDMHSSAPTPGPEQGWVRVSVGDYVVDIPAHCPHRGAPLANGTLLGYFLQCPWHGATFDLRTGARLRGPMCDDLPVRPFGLASRDDATAADEAERRTA